MARWLFRIASVTVLPLAVYGVVVLVGPRLSGGPAVSIRDEFGFAVTNSLLFAAPQFLWLTIALVGRFSARVCDAGLASADAVLIFFCVLVSAQSDTHAGVLWLGYVPLAFIASLLIGGIVRVSARRV